MPYRGARKDRASHPRHGRWHQIRKQGPPPSEGREGPRTATIMLHARWRAPGAAGWRKDGVRSGHCFAGRFANDADERGGENERGGRGAPPRQAPAHPCVSRQRRAAGGGRGRGTDREAFACISEGDRKAYFETYEQTKTRNEDTIKDVRERNERLRKDIAKLKVRTKPQRAVVPAPTASPLAPPQSASGNVSEDRSIEKENVRLTKLRGAYDALRNQMRAESNQLQHLQVRPLPPALATARGNTSLRMAHPPRRCCCRTSSICSRWKRPTMRTPLRGTSGSWRTGSTR